MMTEEQRRFEQWAAGIYDTRLLKDEKGNYRGQVLKQLWQAWQAALTQPASPDLKLPDAKPDHDSEDGNDIDYLEPSQVYALGVDDGFNRCLREVLKLNAPHTAPIESICATGGAEWVKVSERMPEIGQEVLIRIPVCEYFNIENATYKGDGKFTGAWCSSRGDGCSYKVTHWMPLPASPEAE